MQSALEGLSTIGGGNVSVVQNANVYRVTFTNALAGVNVPLFEAAGTAGAVVNDAYGLTVSKNLQSSGTSASITPARSAA